MLIYLADWYDVEEVWSIHPIALLYSTSILLILGYSKEQCICQETSSIGVAEA